MREISSDVRVVLTSGFRGDHRVTELLDAGVVSFLEKPYTLRSLSQAVGEALETRDAGLADRAGLLSRTATRNAVVESTTDRGHGPSFRTNEKPLPDRRPDRRCLLGCMVSRKGRPIASAQVCGTAGAAPAEGGTVAAPRWMRIGAGILVALAIAAIPVAMIVLRSVGVVLFAGGDRGLRDDARCNRAGSP